MSGDTRVLSDEDHRELLRLQVEALGGQMLGGYTRPAWPHEVPPRHRATWAGVA